LPLPDGLEIALEGMPEYPYHLCLQHAEFCHFGDGLLHHRKWYLPPHELTALEDALLVERVELFVLDQHEFGLAHGLDELLQEFCDLLFPTHDESLEQIEAVQFSPLLRDPPFLSDFFQQVVNLLPDLLLHEESSSQSESFSEGREESQRGICALLGPLCVHFELDVLLQAVHAVRLILDPEFFEGLERKFPVGRCVIE